MIINSESTIPIGSMYGIYTYIWLKFMVNVGKYTIHGSYGIYYTVKNDNNTKKNHHYPILSLSIRFPPQRPGVI